MGGGRTKRSELPKEKVDLRAVSPPRDQLGDTALQLPDLCERLPEVPFVVLPGADVRVGMRVRIFSAANPMLVLSDEEEPIGTIDDACAVLLRGCVLIGYEFEGEVIVLEENNLVGVLELRGHIAGGS